MKTLFLIIFAFCLLLPVSAQDRELAERRELRINTPQLLEYPDLHIAAGLGQSPSGYPVMLYDLIPRQSTIGIYGKYLAENGVVDVLINNQGREFALDVQTHPMGWFRWEMATFRLPADVTGEVWIRTMGRFNESNIVRIFVE